LNGENEISAIIPKKRGRPCFISREGLEGAKEYVSDQTSSMQCLTSGPNGAFTAAGIFVPPDGKFDPKKILSQCPHYTKLSNVNAEWLFNQLPRLYQIFAENYYIPEESFSILHEIEGIDNSPPRKGMDLNEMVLNRQRCLIIGSNELRNHQLQRMTAEQEEGRPAKRRNVTKCTHCESAQLQAGVQWAKCKVKHCRKKFCGLEVCLQFLRSHQEEHEKR
jgi:hypothetical protein